MPIMAPQYKRRPPKPSFENVENGPVTAATKDAIAHALTTRGTVFNLSTTDSRQLVISPPTHFGTLYSFLAMRKMLENRTHVSNEEKACR